MNIQDIIFINSSHAVCNGTNHGISSAADAHPKVSFSLNEKTPTACPYCGQLFLQKNK